MSVDNDTANDIRMHWAGVLERLNNAGVGMTPFPGSHDLLAVAQRAEDNGDVSTFKQSLNDYLTMALRYRPTPGCF
jgi:hypothetical protein